MRELPASFASEAPARAFPARRGARSREGCTLGHRHDACLLFAMQAVGPYLPQRPNVRHERRQKGAAFLTSARWRG
jgi:hypothetical protein